MGKRRKRKNEEFNPHLKALILQVVDNQISGYDETGKPIESAIVEEPNYVKNTFDRLSAVHGAEKAKEMVAAVLLTEMYDVMKYQVPFDEEQYRSELQKLR